jgi:hypothetical protein
MPSNETSPARGGATGHGETDFAGSKSASPILQSAANIKWGAR